MSQLSSTTVIQLPNRILRLDVDSEFDRRSESHRCTSETFASTPNTTCAQALMICCQTGRSLAKRVRFFSHHCWSGQIELTADLAGTLTKQELPQAIASESELQSALPPETTATYIDKTLAAGQVWNVTQCDRTEQHCVESSAYAQGFHVDYFGAVPAELTDDLQADELADDDILETLSEHAQQYPTVRANEPRRKAVYRRSIQVACVAALLGTGAFHFYLSSMSSKLRTDASSKQTQFKQLKGDLDEIQTQLVASQNNILRRQKDAETRQEALTQLVSAKLRNQQEAAYIRIIFDSLAECSDGDLWIKGIEFDQRLASESAEVEHDCTITGVALNAIAAAEYADRLEIVLEREPLLDSVVVSLLDASSSDTNQTCEFRIAISLDNHNTPFRRIGRLHD